jgi:hypothetical protein
MPGHFLSSRGIAESESELAKLLRIGAGYFRHGDCDSLGALASIGPGSRFVGEAVIIYP